MAISQVSDRDARAFLAQLESQAAAGDRQQRAEAAGYQQLLAATKEAFRWGRIDRRTQHFQPPARSGDAAIYESQDLMHRRTRNEVLNNAQIKRIVEALTDLIVGPGMLTFADPFDPLLDITSLSRDNLDEHITYSLEADDLFDEWFGGVDDAGQFDVAGKRSGPEVQRMLVSECVERGGVLLVRTNRNDPRRIVPRCWQVVEYDQLDLSYDRPAAPGVNKIVHGIELDAAGREVAFYIYDDHPFDDFSAGTMSGKSSKVSADRVKHLCLFRRPSQSIGVNWLHAIGQNNFDRDKLVGNELQTSTKAATLLLVHYMKNLSAGGTLGLSDGEESTDAYGNEEMKMGSSPMAVRVSSEDEIDLVENTRPATNAENFVSILDHDTAGGTGISYYTLTGRYDKTNYTSVRGALLAEDTHIRPLQNWFAAHVALPIRRDFQQMAIAMGRLKSVTASEYRKNPRRYNRFDAIGAGRELLDPEAETSAITGKMRSCLTTLKEACARQGKHWIRVLRQIQLENRLLDILDISLDLSKGQGGQVTGNTRSKRDQQEAQEAGQEATR